VRLTSPSGTSPRFARHPSRAGTATRRHVRTRNALVIAQLALSLPLLVGAAALSRSFSGVIGVVDPGFSTENGLSLHMAIPRTKYDSDERIAVLYRQIVDRVAAVPGVVSAGMVNRLPLAGNNFVLPFELESAPGKSVMLQVRSVTPDYFRTMSIPSLQGRTLDERDGAMAPLVAAERWLNMAIIVAFAGASLLLAGAGLYGVIASSVTDRRREFGVRLALGATRSDVSRLVLRKGAALAGTGAALGLGGAVALIRGMESLLYGVPRFDPVSFSAAGALLFGVALIASYLPARRAPLTDPARTLRTE
jgi:hypothetical protein